MLHAESGRDLMAGRTPNGAADALVFFGATGDLAYKKIFPALAAMAAHGHLEVPVIGVARAGWDRERLIERARQSLADHGGVPEDVFDQLAARLRYVDGDYTHPRPPSPGCARNWVRPEHRCTTWPSPRRCS